MSSTSIRAMAEQCRRILAKGKPNRDAPFSIKELELQVRNECHVEMKGEIYQWKGQEGGWSVSESYIAEFILDVKSNENIEWGREYVDVPTAYASLPYSQGVRSCTPYVKEERFRKAMIPLPPDVMDVAGDLPAGALEGLRCFEITKGRLFFPKTCNRSLKDDQITKVKVKLVSMDPTAVDSKELFFFPPEYRSSVIQKVLAIYGQTLNMEKDVVSNENPNR